MFVKSGGNWTDFRSLPGLLEIDLHAKSDEHDGLAYQERMEAVARDAVSALRSAQRNGMQYVMFVHGHSTSRRGATTQRSQIRKVMRSAVATPYVNRGASIQHPTVFVAAIKPLRDNSAR